MKKILFFLFFLLVPALMFENCVSNNIVLEYPYNSHYGDKRITIYSIDKLKKIHKSGGLSNWRTVKSAKLIYSLLVYTGNKVAIGYRPKGMKYQQAGGLFKSEYPKWIEGRSTIFSVIEQEEYVESIDEIWVSANERAPNFIVKIEQFSSIESLLTMSEIRYIEPLGDLSFLSFDYIPPPQLPK